MSIIIKLLKKIISKFLNNLGYSIVKDGSFLRYNKNVLGVLSVIEPNIKILTDPRDEVVGISIRETGGWEKKEIKILKKVYKNLKKSLQNNLLVVGAHVGSILLKLANDFKSIDAVEASPQNFFLLKQNVAINNIQNINCYNFLASDSNSYKKFLLHPTNTGGCKLMPIFKEYNYLIRCGCNESFTIILFILLCIII